MKIEKRDNEVVCVREKEDREREKVLSFIFFGIKLRGRAGQEPEPYIASTIQRTHMYIYLPLSFRNPTLFRSQRSFPLT